jgi:hypothetical protein
MSKVRLTGATSGYTEITAPAVAGSNTITLPTGNGTADQRLVTNGSGALSFTSDVMLAAGSAGSPSLYFSGDTNTGMWSPAADTLAWSTGGTERMRVKANGETTIGGYTGSNPVADAATGIWLNGSGVGYFGATDNALYVRRKTTNGAVVAFYRDAPLVGSISVTTTATAYNTSSDYRLKENIVPISGSINRLLQLKPSRFNFIADPNAVVDGFIAHEAAAVVPECVTGEKDEVDEDGDPVYQGIDQSKVVPLLTAALQEAIAMINALEARVTALEAN